jgi:hypothetical protein
MLNSRGLIVDLKLMIYFQASLQRVEERTRQFPNGAKYGVTKFSGKYIVPTRPTLGVDSDPPCQTRSHSRGVQRTLLDEEQDRHYS